MAKLENLENGDRLLYRINNAGTLKEGVIGEYSPSEKYVSLGYGEWHRSDTVEVVEKLAAYEEPKGFIVPDEPGPLKVVVVNTEPIATVNVKPPKVKAEPEPAPEVDANARELPPIPPDPIGDNSSNSRQVPDPAQP